MIDDKFSITFGMDSFPHDVDLTPVNVNKIDRIEDDCVVIKSEHPYSLSDAQKRMLENIKIDFVNKEDDLVAENVRRWYDLCFSYQNQDPISDFFTLFECDGDKSSDNALTLSYRLKKPVDELTADDMVKLKKVLKENFSVKNPEETIEKWLGIKCD